MSSGVVDLAIIGRYAAVLPAPEYIQIKAVRAPLRYLTTAPYSILPYCQHQPPLLLPPPQNLADKAADEDSEYE